MSASIIASVLTEMLRTRQEKWSENAEFCNLRRLAHEQVGRELFWNQECLAVRKQDEAIAYLELIRTEAFDSLVNIGAPLDEIFATRFRLQVLTDDAGRKAPQRYLDRLKYVDRLSLLLDRAYNRLWMLRHRAQLGLKLGDVGYLRYLVSAASNEIDFCRSLLYTGEYPDVSLERRRRNN